MAAPSASYSITMRVLLDDPQGVGRITTAIGEAGGSIVALDVVDASASTLVVDLTCYARDGDHAEELTKAAGAVPGVAVRAVSDRTLLTHLGGVLATASKVALRTRDDLSMVYTPGVARVCLAIAEDKAAARNLTIVRNSVAVVTDGSAVLGLGNLGAKAALPVMEGKAVLFKTFADIDAWPVCLDTQDVDEIVRTVEVISPSYGAINLEDIAAPRCFAVEARLRERLDIPVFHDDQHGTAIVVLAALTNALRVVGKEIDAVRIVVLGAGAAGTAIIKILVATGARDIVAVDREGIVSARSAGGDPTRQWLAHATNPGGLTGGIDEALAGADVLIGVSGSNLVSEAALATMASHAVVFVLANPDPEIDPEIARAHASVVATGRSDEPNQINNVLAFPGVFRGLLDAHAHEVTAEMEVAAARAIAGVVSTDELSAAYIIPSVFNPAVVPAVATAVHQVAARQAASQ
ncbi:MAG: malic enzyme-like NAD(P)-binding protein [Acidimicrobiales bacterium]